MYPENGIRGFFIGGVSLYDILRGGTNGLLSVEVDPLFTKWSRTNTYVKAESDPQFNAWVSTFREVDPLFIQWTRTNTYVKVESDPQFEEWRASFSEQDPIFDEWTKTNTYVKVEEDPLFNAWKDNFSEADPFFFAVFGNPILNLLAYDEINLAGTNVVTVTAPMFKVSNSIVVGKDNTVVVSNANIIGNSNRAGVKGWYYTGIQFTTNAAGVAQINQPATIYLTDDIAKRNTGTLETDSSFVSGFKIGDPVCIVNNSKYDM